MHQNTCTGILGNRITCSALFNNMTWLSVNCPCFIYRLHFSTELAQQRDVKFIFCGQVIEDDDMHDWCDHIYGVTNNFAIHVHISQPRTQTAEQEPAANQTDENDILDLSNLFVPLFGVILGIVWVCFFMWLNS